MCLSTTGRSGMTEKVHFKFQCEMGKGNPRFIGRKNRGFVGLWGVVFIYNP